MEEPTHKRRWSQTKLAQQKLASFGSTFHKLENHHQWKFMQIGSKHMSTKTKGKEIVPLKYVFILCDKYLFFIELIS